MSEHADMLRATEAAIVSGVALREVNRAADEHILPTGYYVCEGNRLFRPAACVFIAFFHDCAEKLTREYRREAIQLFECKLRHVEVHDWLAIPSEGWTYSDRCVTVNITEIVQQVASRYEKLRAANDAVTSSSDVMGGTEVLRGTRVPVHDVAASVAAGYPADRIRDAYPSLTEEQIELAVVYARANKPRGRPRSSASLSTGTRKVQRKIVRRKNA